MPTVHTLFHLEGKWEPGIRETVQCSVQGVRPPWCQLVWMPCRPTFYEPRTPVVVKLWVTSHQKLGGL